MLIKLFQYLEFIFADVRFGIRDVLLRFFYDNSFRKVDTTVILLISPYYMRMVDVGAHRNCPCNAIQINLNPNIGACILLFNLTTILVLLIKCVCKEYQFQQNSTPRLQKKTAWKPRPFISVSIFLFTLPALYGKINSVGFL